MDQNNIIECGGFFFIHNFDSGNLGHVERVPTELIGPWPSALVPNATSTAMKGITPSDTPDYEFNLWTRPDCAGTEFENGNRTWFYFGVQASEPNALVRLNLINLNKQGKMYNQGMAPVTRTLPGKPQWERIRDRPIHSTDDSTFTLSFKYRTCENTKATTFFAFTYPFSFAELQIALNSIDLKMLPVPPPQSQDDIYYCRECLIYSLEGRRVDLLTISSYHGITTEREERLRNLFPEPQERPFKFQNKKIIFISARVHPGETPSSFVFNGFLNLLLNRHDPIAIQLRKFYVFKMIPFLNPDGVARGHYRTDTRGVNLNRVYLNPSLALHPTVYASRALIRYYHYGCEKDDMTDDSKSFISRSIQNITENSEILEPKKKKSHTNYKAGDSKRPVRNKSSTTIKQSDSTAKKDVKGLSGEAANLAEQVYDMTLKEMPSQTSHSSKGSNENEVEPSLLNETILKNCLGSNIHLSTSEELNIQGSNPLRPLRESLKNSISLLMGSPSSIGGDRDSSISTKDSRLANVKMGWCRECRDAVNQLEDTMPGITNMVPGYSASCLKAGGSSSSSNPTYQSIDEYREHQRQEIDKITKLADAKEQDSAVYFCTNCFKRYVISEDNEEIKVTEPALSRTSVAVSAGDSGSVRARPGDGGGARVAHIGDAASQPVSKEEKKPKSKKGRPIPPPPAVASSISRPPPKETDSGLYLYIDLHGHASKKGIFMYGNHFDDVDNCVECMLLPRIMSLNNLHFHFSSCNFTERNMYLKDRRDGMSREGSGRVAVYKATGLVRSYTLECNYNTGRLVNVLPPTLRDGALSVPPPAGPLPPKYTPHIFEEGKVFRRNLEVFEEMNPQEVGRSLGASILDLTGQHPNSRIPCSEHRNLGAVRDWLRAHTRSMKPMLNMSRLRPKTASPIRQPLYLPRGKNIAVKEERKENAYAGRVEERRTPPGQRSGHDIISMNMRLARPPPRVESKSKLAAKRKNIVLGVRKPNTSKTQLSKPRARRVSPCAAGKRSGGGGRAARCRAMASSSSEELWDEPRLPAPAKRRVHPPHNHHLKKIRLKNPL